MDGNVIKTINVNQKLQIFIKHISFKACVAENVISMYV